MKQGQGLVRLVVGLAAAALMVAGLGCAMAPAKTAAGAADSGLPGQGDKPGDAYVIGQADELEVQVWEEPDLSRTVTVRADGLVSLPLINEVRAEGQTIKQLRDQLTEKFKEVVADPVVSVIVTKPLSATFFITGKVTRPQEYPLFKQTTILQAVASAGGFTQWAKTGSLIVVRKSGERVKVDYDSIVSGDMSQNIILQRGDTVVVP